MSATQSFASLQSIQQTPVSGFASPADLLSFYLYRRGAWDANAVALAAVLAGTIAAFVLVFAGLSRGAGESEVRLARRSLALGQAALALLLARHAAQLALDLLVLARRAPPRNELTVQWPDFAVARPGIGALVALLGLLLNTHHAFRWLLVAAQPLFVALEIVNASALQLMLGCLGAGSCTQQATGLSLAELPWALRLHYAGAALGTWAALSACVALSIIGTVGPRFPVRLFDTAASLESITHQARDTTARNRERAALRAAALAEAEIDAEAQAVASPSGGLASPAGAVPLATGRSRFSEAVSRDGARSMRAHHEMARAMHHHKRAHKHGVPQKVVIGNRAAHIASNIMKVAQDNFLNIITSGLQR